jgi:hypothetical protein
MMDVYYEVQPGCTVLGREHKYIAQFNYHPEDSTPIERRFHLEATMNSERVWIENANGVTLIKNKRDLAHRWEPVNYKELTWIKLQAVDLLA